MREVLGREGLEGVLRIEGALVNGRSRGGAGGGGDDWSFGPGVGGNS